MQSINLFAYLLEFIPETHHATKFDKKHLKIRVITKLPKR